MPTLLVLTGFEFGYADNLSLQSGPTANRLFDAVANPVLVTSDPLANGGYALANTPSGTFPGVTWYTTPNSGALGSATSLVGGLAIWFPSSLPSTNLTVTESYADGFNLSMRIFYQASSGRLCNQVGVGTVRQGPVMTADTRYWVTFRYTVSANPHRADWSVNGVAQTQATATSAAASIDNWSVAAQSGETGTVRIDDLVASTTSSDYPLVPHKVVLLQVDTGGSTAEIGTANATARFVNTTVDATHNSADILAALAEVPPVYGASGSGVVQQTSGTGNAVSVPMTSYALQAGESISGVRVLVAGYSPSSGTSNVELRAYDGSSETTLFPRANVSFSNASTSGWIAKMYTPSGGWTQAKLDALEVRYGYSNDVSPNPGAHAIYAEVAVAMGGVAPDPPPRAPVVSQTAVHRASSW